MKKPDIVVALDMVIECFEKLSIAYYIGYLKHWAARLNLSDLLDRSFDDAGLIESA